MTFSYRLEKHILLEDISLPLDPGTFVLLSGIENQAFVGAFGGFLVFKAVRMALPKKDQ